MFKYLVNHFIKRVVKNNDGWIEWAIPAITSLVGGFLGDDEEDKTTTQTSQRQEYPEAAGARQKWWETLQGWNAENQYGNLPFDWAGIWDQAKAKVNQYFWGGPGTTGVADKIKASAARKGTSDSPALENNLLKMGVQQGNMLSEVAQNQANEQVSLANQGKNTWLQSLMSLAGLSPQGQTATTTAPVTTPGWGSAISDIGSSFGKMIGMSQQQNWLSNLLNPQNEYTKLWNQMMPNTTQSNILGFNTGLYRSSR